MAQKIIFTGDELEFLMKMDQLGCVLTDHGKFYCDLENDKLAMQNRLPVRIRGEYAPCEAGWRITYRVMPAPRTWLIGGIFLLLFAASLLSFLAADGSITGSALFGILCAALVVNYVTQYKACAKRFENAVGKRQAGSV